MLNNNRNLTTDGSDVQELGSNGCLRLVASRLTAQNILFIYLFY